MTLNSRIESVTTHQRLGLKRDQRYGLWPNKRQAQWLLVGVLVMLLSGVGAMQALAQTPSSTQPMLVAESIEDLQQQQRTLDEQRRQLQQQQTELQNRQADSESTLESLERNIVYTANQIADTEYRLEQAMKALEQLQQELEAAEKNYEDVRTGTVARLQFLQRQQGSEGWAVLLQSQNFNQFLDRQYQLKRVYAADRQVLEDLRVQAEAIQQQKVALEEQRNQVALLRQQLLSQKQQYEAEAAEEKQLISRLQDRRGALEAAENQLARDSEQIATMIRQKVAAQTGGVRGTGRFVIPTNARISSGFGNRIHPILGYSRFHSGVDFAASHGTTIRAADSGRVIFSGWYGGYGQTVIVDHGGGLSTLYAHASRLFVKEGQSVRQGEAIAAVGSTGLSTGPHLHFEVRQNGNPVNPMGYL